MMIDIPLDEPRLCVSIPIEDLRSFLDDFPALLWRIEIARSRIEFLNDYPLQPLGDSARLFLKNRAFRKQMLLPEDSHLLDKFLDAVSQGKTMATVFRVHTPNDSIMWLKLTGAVNSSDPRYYYGYLLDVGDTVNVIRDIQRSEEASRNRIDHVPTPIILFNHQSLRLRQANAAACHLFGLPNAATGRLPHFSEISLHPVESLGAILNDLPTHPWNGVFEFSTTQGEPFRAETELRWVPWKQTALVRMSVTPISDDKKDETKLSENVRAAFENAPDLSAMLGQALEHPDISKRCNAIMLSCICARNNVVQVYGTGAPLANMAQGEKFSYRGTIAEDIARFNLDHLVVDETMDSIKPIDWALFIPHGIHSYYAKPFYMDGELQTVLILCSTEPERFVDVKPERFDTILSSLNKAINALRKKKS
ncbi:PAS domain-containing protein [Pseudodesulfovibrio indicus]|uniref:PAS domain-containing protein n=1 Tax=Pseudodesulfovibrio indicus TaxID=1716143 RepID=UPI00292FBA40|nr:PAS domain-containing protein [Pseudodesulfovibrio indicus]